MSGHSKWSTIKHKKEATDAARGKLFSKLVKGISIAAKTGGGANPETNAKLRVAIEQAKNANMPKENIDRAVNKATSDAANLEEISYEGFGPFGISLIIETATDNRNRTVSEIKGILEKGGGALGGVGSVSFNFEPKGFIFVKNKKEKDEDTLELIDLGAEDIEASDEGIEVYVEPAELFNVKGKIEKAGFKVVSADLIKNPKTLKEIADEEKAKKAISFLNLLEEHDDVQKVFSNIDVSEKLLRKII